MSGSDGRLPWVLLNTDMPAGDITNVTNFRASSLFFALALTPYPAPAAAGMKVLAVSSLAGSGLSTNLPLGFLPLRRAITQLPWTRPSVLPVAASSWLAS